MPAEYAGLSAVPIPMSDVYCFGHVSTGVILRLKDRYPAPDGYAEVSETLENHSGEATGSALVLAQFGARVTLEGNWIGDNPECRRTLAFLKSRGIDCSGLVVQPGYQGVKEVVISDGATRTVFGRYCDLLFATPQWEVPRIERIRQARVACVDPSFGEATLMVARTAHVAGIPVVTCDTRFDSPLAGLASVVVISGEFLQREFPEATKDDRVRAALFERYMAAVRGLVVFTAGSSPLWYAHGGDVAGKRAAYARRELSPFKVDVVDSAGAGDSFRGGLIYGLLQGWSDEDCLRFASAVAALICTTAPGCVHPPTLAQTLAFLSARGAPVPLI